MEIIGTIQEVFQPVSGTSQRGNPYTTQVIVITYGDQYPKNLALTLMTRQVETYGAYLAPGQKLKFYFEVSSREYNGRYYTECSVWKIESLQAQQQSFQAAPMPAPAPMPGAVPQQRYSQPPAPMPSAAPPSQFPPSAQQQMPDYAPQQYQQPPGSQGHNPTAENLPFPRQ